MSRSILRDKLLVIYRELPKRSVCLHLRMVPENRIHADAEELATDGVSSRLRRGKDRLFKSFVILGYDEQGRFYRTLARETKDARRYESSILL